MASQKFILCLILCVALWTSFTEGALSKADIFRKVVQSRQQERNELQERYAASFIPQRAKAARDEDRLERKLMALYHRDSLAIKRGDGSPPPNGWTCADYAYNDSYVCDCNCTVHDPDCDNPDNSVDGCDSEYATCPNTSCVLPTIDGWNCTYDNYNTSDGCDCNCGIPDPDCNDPNAVVFGCESLQYAVCDKRGLCQPRPSPPVRLYITNGYFISGACGKILKASDQDPSIQIAILNENWELVDDDSVKYTVYATAVPVNNNTQFELAGSTNVTAYHGTAYFDKLLVLGPADAEFNILFESHPKLIPVLTSIPVSIDVGTPVSTVVKWIDLKQDADQRYLTGTDFTVEGTLYVIDDCNNPVPNPPTLTCDFYPADEVYDPVTLSCGEANYTFSDNSSKINISLTMPSNAGDYVVVFSNFALGDTQYILNSYTFSVIDKSQFECYALEDPYGIEITHQDVVNFDTDMVDTNAQIKISQNLFSADQVRPNMMEFVFAQSNLTKDWHTSINKDYADWFLAAKHFYVEQDPNYLQVISIGLVSVDPVKVDVKLQKPFCGSMDDTLIRNLFGKWLFFLSDKLATLKSTNTLSSDTSVQSTADVVCYGSQKDYNCCDRYSVEDYFGECQSPSSGSLSIALIVLSLVFSLCGSIYVALTVGIFIQQSGAIITNIDDDGRLSPAEFTKKKRTTFLTYLVAPVLAILGIVQTIILVGTDNPYSPVRIPLAIILCILTVVWWIFSFIKFFWQFVSRTTPPLWVDKGHFAMILVLTFFSTFNLFWTFIWVTLGLLLNPNRVLPYFVAFVTVFLVAVLKINSLAQLLKRAEVELKKELLKKALSSEALTEEDYNLLATQDMDGNTLKAFLDTKPGMSETEKADIVSKIAQFRRFRVRFLTSNLIGGLSVFILLIVFILMGVEAFSGKSDAVAVIGSALEVVSGLGATVSDKLGDQQDSIKQLISRFLPGFMSFLDKVMAEPKEDDNAGNDNNAVPMRNMDDN